MYADCAFAKNEAAYYVHIDYEAASSATEPGVWNHLI